MSKLQEAIDQYDRVVANIGGCGDGYCLVTGKAKGQHTNGGCRCFHPAGRKGDFNVRQLVMAARLLRDALTSGE